MKLFKTKKYKDQTIEELKCDIKLNSFFAGLILIVSGIFLIEQFLFPVVSDAFIVGFGAFTIALSSIFLITIVTISNEIRLREYVTEKLGEKANENRKENKHRV